jgi:hypothetical protein
LETFNIVVREPHDFDASFADPAAHEDFYYVIGSPAKYLDTLKYKPNPNFVDCLGATGDAVSF